VVLHECIALIEAHISEPLKVNDLAAMMNYTPNYLYKIFEELLHVSCKQFILQYKLNRSLYLLKSTEDSVQSIASQLAFSSLYHFSAVFKGEYGISPLRYRHSVKKPVTYPF
jgi:AraC-like DNA-binding protein